MNHLRAIRVVDPSVIPVRKVGYVTHYLCVKKVVAQLLPRFKTRRFMLMKSNFGDY